MEMGASSSAEPVNFSTPPLLQTPSPLQAEAIPHLGQHEHEVDEEGDEDEEGGAEDGEGGRVLAPEDAEALQAEG